MRSAVEQFKYRVGLAFSQKSASGVGNIIDRQGYESVTFIVATGAVTTASVGNTLTVSLEASDDPAMSGAEDVTVANGLVGSNILVDATGLANKSGAFGYTGTRRYLRPKVTEAGTADAILGVIAVLGQGVVRPESAFSTLA
jgi:hypothetical protein